MHLIGIGIDLVDVIRIEKMLARQGHERVLRKLLRPGERAYVAGLPYPAKNIAARIAAKEAVYKALQSLPGARAVGWQDLEVERDGEGRPTMALVGHALELARAHGPLEIHLSLSHSDHTAGAVAAVTRSAD